MKILVTGFTEAHVGKPTPKPRRETAITLLVRGMRELGHEVVQKEVLPTEGDVFDGVELLICGISPPLSVGGHYAFLGLAALARAIGSGTPCALLADDWHFAQQVRQWQTCAITPARLLEGKQAGERHSAEWAAGPARSALQNVIEVLGMQNATWPPVIIPRFGWGKAGKKAAGFQLPASRMIHLDPTSMITTYPVTRVDPETRRRAWVLGTMSDQWKWLDELHLTWPSYYYGPPAASPPDSNKSLPEDEQVASYGPNWGLLAPRHPAMDGLGFWRARLARPGLSRSVVLSDPADLKPLGSPYSDVLPNLGLVQGARVRER